MDYQQFISRLGSVKSAKGKRDGAYVDIKIIGDKISFKRTPPSKRNEKIDLSKLYNILLNEPFISNAVVRRYINDGVHSPTVAILTAAGFYDLWGMRIPVKKKGHIVCNLLYNNGGEGIKVGFVGRCSLDNIVYNVEKGGRWCSEDACTCREFYDSGFSSPPSDPEPCNESVLFENYQWNSGTEFETGEPLKMLGVTAGKIAILTTVFAGTKEKDRRIVGLMKIGKVKDQHVIISDAANTLRLDLEIARALNFWAYYKNNDSNNAKWSRRRFRYLVDHQVAAILHDLLLVLRDSKEKEFVRQTLKNDFPFFALRRPTVDGLVDKNPVEEIEEKRKYGPSGESDHHKKLKEFVATNPTLFGLSEKYTAALEYPFPSRDRVDIIFRKNNNENDSVVIEIELNDVLPGIHQAIKYRALRCAERGLPLDHHKVRAMVVAWSFTEAEKDLCEKYNIQHHSYKVVGS